MMVVLRSGGRLVRRAGPHGLIPPIIERRASIGKGSELILEISDRANQERDGQIELTVLILWFPLVGIIGIVVWSAAISVFRPLTKMAEVAAGISDDELARRLPKAYGAEYDRFAENLNGLLDRAQRSVARQEQFAYDAAHELRTPLTIISGLLQEEI